MIKTIKNKFNRGRFLKIDRSGKIREEVRKFIQVNTPPKNQLEVIKYWDREYSVFTLSAFVKMLEVMNYKGFGDNSFSSFVFFYHHGTSEHFRSLAESRTFEKIVGKKFINNKFIRNEAMDLHTVNGEHLIGMFKQIKTGKKFDSDFITDFGLSFGAFAGANTCIQRSADYIAQYPQSKALLRRLIKQRTKYEYVMSFYDKYFEKLCIKIAKSKKINNPNLLRLLTLREFIDFMNSGRLPAFLSKREECCAIFILPTPKLLIGNRAKLLLGSMLNEEKKRNKKLLTEEIRGMGIYPGKVKGFVQLITNVKDLPKFKKGNILVSSTTLPQYNTALIKAKGIIADEGGILTHAAVCSREFKIPGIIGTKIATKVLKNGDLIEIDAKKGVIKIIK